MEIKKYRPSKGFIWTLLLVFFSIWLLFKYVPLTNQRQEQEIKKEMDYQKRKAVEVFDTVTDEEQAKLPKINYKKYALEKRNGRFWLIPREYYGDGGFNIRWPTDVNEILGREWSEENKGNYSAVHVFMYSRQYELNDYIQNEKFSNKEPCVNKNYWFVWNGINIRLYDIYAKNLTDKQYMDVCFTALKILNEKIKEIHYVN